MSTPASKTDALRDDRDADAQARTDLPPLHEDGALDSLGKAITAPMRDDPGTDTDEKPEDQPGASSQPRP